jgi:hypothetical protein
VSICVNTDNYSEKLVKLPKPGNLVKLVYMLELPKELLNLAKMVSLAKWQNGPLGQIGENAKLGSTWVSKGQYVPAWVTFSST